MSAARQADLLVRDIDWLITVDPKRRVVREADVAVKGGKLILISEKCLHLHSEPSPH